MAIIELKDLLPSNSYVVQVQAEYGDGTTSEWSIPTTFFTPLNRDQYLWSLYNSSVGDPNNPTTTTGILKSANFNGVLGTNGNIVPGSEGNAGWAIDYAGYGVFNNIKARGTIEAEAGFFGPSAGNQWLIGTSDPSIYYDNPTGNNFLYNYDYNFETGTFNSYWKPLDSGTGSPALVSSSPCKYGTYAAYLGIFSTGSSTALNSRAILYADSGTSTRIPVPSGFSGKTYTISAYIRRVDTSVTSATLTVRTYSSSTGGTALGTYSSSISPTTSFARVAKAFSFDAATTHFEVEVSTNASFTASGAGNYYAIGIDYVSLQEGSFEASEVLTTAPLGFYLRSRSDALYSLEIKNSGNTVFSITPGGALNTVSTATVGQLRITAAGEASSASSAHGFQIGATDGLNIRMDSNEIQGANNGDPSNVSINKDGGSVTLSAPGSFITLRAPSRASDGTVSAPAYSFTNATNVGMFLNGTTLSFSAGNTTSMSISDTLVNIPNSTDLAVDGIVRVSLGAVGAPSYTFSGDTDTGMYSPGAGRIAWARNGVVNFQILGPVTSSYNGRFDWNDDVEVAGNNLMFTGATMTGYRQLIINPAGYSPSYYISSIASTLRVKQDVSSIQERLVNSRFLELDPVTYRYIREVEQRGEDAGWDSGFIAERAQELGLDWLYQLDKDGLPDYFAYDKLPIYLFAFVKDQQKRIASLEERLAALENK